MVDQRIMKSKKIGIYNFLGNCIYNSTIVTANQISIEVLAVIVVSHFPMYQLRLSHTVLTEKPFDSFQPYTGCDDLN